MFSSAAGYQNSDGSLIAVAVDALEQPYSDNFNFSTSAAAVTLDLPCALATPSVCLTKYFIR
ncbi:MAG: hypothetical protein DMF56_15750 [Acidobacteria bacterium]|nr:MAG: hypothetical protein DMF56_15750 [Acidobacteriota bacterium]